jgi:hypothetical protein
MSKRLLIRALASIIAVLTLSLAASADIWYVDKNSPAGSSGDGTEWAEAFDDLQDALQKDPPPDPDDQIWVAEGTYATDEGDDGDPTDSTFALLDRVSVYGGFLNGDDFEDRDPAANETTLTGVLTTTSGNAEHVVTADSNVTDLTLLDGFIITGGAATAFGGGGIYCVDGYPVIRGCTITGNDAGGDLGGGGIFCRNAADGASGFMKIWDCLISDNTAGFGGGISIQAKSGVSRV